MTKTNLFAITLLFASTFFVGAKAVKASADCDSCMEIATDMADCIDYCTEAAPAYDGTEESGSNSGINPNDAYLNNNPVDTTANDYQYTLDTSNSSATCDASSSCWFYNCCSSSSSQPTAQTPAQIAQANANQATAVSGRNAATRELNAANAAIAGACSDPSSSECTAAKNRAIAADMAFRTADAELTNAMLAAANGSASGSGAIDGLVISGNGVLGPECRDSAGNYSSGCPSYGVPTYSGGTGGGLPGGSVYGASGVTTPKCGTNFQEVAGVCFPVNTGLSNAPVYVILSNIFSWLMGLFTTFAVMAFVVSGIQYFMSAGDEGMAETAKDNAKAALVGIVVGLSGFIIIKAISAALSGQSYIF